MDSTATAEMPEFRAPQATDNHKWLSRFVGNWDGEAEMLMGPDQPPMTSRGALRYRMLGELWLIGEMETPMPDGAPSSVNIITLGYDSASQRFQGSFISPMMTRQWVYDGLRDGNTLTLDTIGPDMSAGCDPAASAELRLVPYQDIITLVSPDEHTLRSQMQQPDGSWIQFMQCRYTRK